MAEPSNVDNGMWAPLTWTQSAAALAANVGRGAADSWAHASLLRKPAEQRRLARIGADWVDCPDKNCCQGAAVNNCHAESWHKHYIITRCSTDEINHLSTHNAQYLSGAHVDRCSSWKCSIAIRITRHQWIKLTEARRSTSLRSSQHRPFSWEVLRSKPFSSTTI